jgi:hypothetical protein
LEIRLLYIACIWDVIIFAQLCEVFRIVSLNLKVLIVRSY